jgi:hypothetical protein
MEELAYTLISIAMAGSSVAIVLYGAWLSVTFGGSELGNTKRA